MTRTLAGWEIPESTALTPDGENAESVALPEPQILQSGDRVISGYCDSVYSAYSVVQSSGVLLLAGALHAAGAELKPVVEIEEDVYTYTGANNGAGPMWCAGSTSLVRVGERVFATGLETLPDARPLNNCRWVLFERKPDTGWERVHEDEGRTREPAPVAAFHRGAVFVSGNPTVGKGPEPGGGPAQPDLWEFSLSHPAAVEKKRLLPQWQGSPPFREHSYRSLAADGSRGELVLFQNIGYGHAEWTFRDVDGAWSARGRISWPAGADYAKPKPVRLCYPNVAMKDGAVHFFGIGDITEPVEAWRLHKKKLSGREWDYVFRRLYYTWTSDIRTKPFHAWIEIANRDRTAGHLWPCDLWLAPDGTVHLLWSERAIDLRLREAFFPEEKQAHRLNYAVLREGTIVLRRTLLSTTEAEPGLVANRARFHSTPGNGLVVVVYVAGTGEGGKPVAENRIAKIRADGSMGRMVTLPLQRTFSSFFTATPRAGSPPSNTLDLLGPQAGKTNTIGYARVRLF